MLLGGKNEFTGTLPCETTLVRVPKDWPPKIDRDVLAGVQTAATWIAEAVSVCARDNDGDIPTGSEGPTRGPVELTPTSKHSLDDAKKAITSPSPVPQNRWLTVKQCAELLLKDVSGLDMKRAMARVSFAASENKFRTNGKKGNARRVDRDSFSTWRLEQRERDIDADNEGH